jgi:phosphoribosyl 1,2-cyclic phosphodiesterase
MVQVHLCGVRGSTPTPGIDFVGVGGNTSCVAIAEDGRRPSLVLDAGTGLRNVSRLMAGDAFCGTIVLGHLHWDHVMGLPFFAAGDRPDAVVDLLVPDGGVDAATVLGRLMGPPLFPISPSELRGSWRFSTYGEGTFVAGAFTIVAREIPHKGGRTMGLRISDGRSSIAYLSDHSPHDLGPGADGLGELHPAAMDLVAGVDLLLHDAQYTSAELPGRASWGHAAAQYCITLAQKCQVGRVLLFHHDPSRTDDQVLALRDELAAANDMPVEVAVEGHVIQL